MHISPAPHTQRLYQLASGKAGIMQTVILMRELVTEYRTHPAVRSLALSLVEFLPGKDESAEIEALFNFVRDHIRYVKDIYEVETLATPDRLLEIRQGDCDDKSTLLAALLESIGYQTMFKVTGYHGNEFEHVYVYVAGLNVAMHLDSTEPESAGWEGPGITAFVYVS